MADTAKFTILKGSIKSIVVVKYRSALVGTLVVLGE